MTTCRVRSTRRRGGSRSPCIVFSVCVVAGLFATAARAGQGGPAVDVTVLENTPTRVVADYSFGDFAKTVVAIDGTDYTRITLGRESHILEAGAPDLPNVCRSIIIPDDAAVAIGVVSASFYEIEDIDVAPSKGNLYRDVDPDSVPYTFGAAYRVNADYPGELATLGEPYILRNHRGVVVRVNPFQYNPVARTLRVYTGMTVEVVASEPGQVNLPAPAAQEPEASRAFHQLYKHHFLNYPPDLRYDPIDETGSMLVICHDAWMPNVQPLVDHKNSIGIETTMVGISEVGNSPISIRNYIQEAYDTGHLTFVLLVGDAAQVATPYASGGSADPTYALLAGSDHYPDIFVGRVSAENATQVDTQVLRTIEYELMPATQQDWFWRGVGIGSDEGAGQGDDGESDHQHIENIRTDLLNYGYTLVDGFYGYSATAAQVANAVNDGRGIINYCGHGSTYSWGTSGFSNANVNALVNDNMLPFIVSVACVNGQFAGYTCFAEAWLRATDGAEPTGAIGMYASSINQSWAPPMCAQDETVDLLCAEAYFSFGALCFAGSCQMMDEYGYAGIEMYDTWHVFGDPSVRVYGTAEPPTGIWVRGDDLHATGQRGGPFAPDSVVYEVENKNETPLDYEVTASVTWVDIANASGTLPARGTIDVTVALNEEADVLGHGLHEGMIYFTNLTDHDGDTERPVSIEVDDMHLRYSFPLDADPGWFTEGQWAFGQPIGGGSHNRDPVSGYTESNVYGYNLTGDYVSNMPAYYLTTDAIDCSHFSFVQLRFWRWLGVESSAYDHAAVAVSNDGTDWTEVWANPVAPVSDSAWVQMMLDISAVADAEPAVYIRWQMGPTDNSVTYPGWNIDDVEIWAASEAEPVAGDLDGDGDVDLQDLAILLANYGSEVPPGEGGDLDGDGDVDLVDLSALLANYGYGV